MKQKIRIENVVTMFLQNSSNNNNSTSSNSSSPKFHPIRGTGDGSSRQGSLTPAGNLESSLGTSALKEFHLKFEEESTIRKVSEVERERLGEHVRVLTKRLRSAEEAVITSEVALRSSRKQNAELQKLLEKAHIELRAGEASTVTSTASSRSYSESDTDILRQELRVTKDNLESISKKREEDLDMYLKLAADSRRMFSQSLKDTVEHKS